VSGAVNPDEAFSKEHWKSSFGLFLTGVGARGVNVPKSTGMPKPNTKVTSPDQESTVSAAQATSATPKLPTLTNISEWYRVKVHEMGLVQDSMGGYHFAVKKGDGGNRVESGGSGKDKSTKEDRFVGTLKRNKINLTGVKIEEILYTKRSPVETAKLRKKFNHS